MTDEEVRIRISIRGASKTLVSRNMATIAKIRALNPGAGMVIRLYYTDADIWSIDEAIAENPAIDKHFRRNDHL